MTTRRRAREIVLQVLFQDDLNPNRNLANDDGFISRRLLANKPLISFAQELLGGVRKNRVALDKTIGAHAVNWSVKRMSTIDRNIMRLATYEIFHADVPDRVAINEAIELAKRYGHHNSSNFVNGILDRTIKMKAAAAVSDAST